MLVLAVVPPVLVEVDDARGRQHEHVVDVAGACAGREMRRAERRQRTQHVRMLVGSQCPLRPRLEHLRIQQDHQALLKAKYCPRLAAASCTQKNTNTHVTLTFDQRP